MAKANQAYIWTPDLDAFALRELILACKAMLEADAMSEAEVDAMHEIRDVLENAGMEIAEAGEGDDEEEGDDA